MLVKFNKAQAVSSLTQQKYRASRGGGGGWGGTS